MSSESQSNAVKIFFEPPGGEEDWHTTVESMWATAIDAPTAPGGRVFQLDNSPWYVFGVSLHDQVCAELRRETFDNDPETYDVLYFTHVWKHSGHSTYTLFLEGDYTTKSPEWTAQWQLVRETGCTFENMNSKLVSVDVPFGVDLDKLEELFEQSLAAGIFAYQTQHRFSVPEVVN